MFEISHTCQGIEEEKQRLYDTGFIPEISVDVSTSDEWEAMVTLHDRLDNKLISINGIDVKFCPYCGTRLPIVGGTGHDQYERQ